MESTQIRILSGLMVVGLWSALAMGGCDSGDDASSEDPISAAGGAGAEPDAGGTGADGDFEACLESLVPNCDVHEMDAADKMEWMCEDLTMIPIPLTSGDQYGPMTVEGGPLGGQTLWNEGAGTEFVNTVSPLEPVCLPFGVETFNEPPSVNAEILNTRDLDYSLYTIFKPACMEEGETYPVITWANGTCGLTHGYAALLGTIASYGYVIIASNSTWTAVTISPEGVPVQLRALDYAAFLNKDPDSVFYQKLDMENVGAMGHSQGAGATRASDGDPRIDAVIFWNSGTSDEKPFLNVSGDRDIGGTAASQSASTDGATQPGAWVWFHQVLETGGGSTGHLVLMEQPERCVEFAVAWWDYWLKGDEQAKEMFVGDDCGLCNRDDELEYGHNSLFN